MAGNDSLSVVHDGQSGVQVGVVAQQVLHEFFVELVVLEEGVVWFKIDVCTIIFLRVFRHITDKCPFLEDNFAYLPVAETPCLEVGA